MKQRIWISMGAIVLGVSTLTIGYAASKSSGEGMCCEGMMRERRGNAEMSHQDTRGEDHGKERSSMIDRNPMGMGDKNHMGMMGKNPMGMMGSGMPKECEEMMRKRGMLATETPGASAPAPTS